MSRTFIPPTLLLTVIVAILAVVTGVTHPKIPLFNTEHNTEQAQRTTHTLIRVIDGDTIVVTPSPDLPDGDHQDDETIIRLIGINTPEIPDECGSLEARAHVEKLLTRASHTLTIIVDNPHTPFDRYGRTLAYVESNDVDVAHDLVKNGLAHAYTPRGAHAPARFQTYQHAERDAEHHYRGIHGELGC